VLVEYRHGTADARLRLGEIAIVPSAATLGRLQSRLGSANVWVEY
jgi:hypothetical protein